MGGERSWRGRSTTVGRRERDSPGCMSCVLQVFDFHQFQFALHQPSFKTHSFLQEDPTVLIGIKPQRNSLESKEGPCRRTVPLSSIMNEEDSNCPIRIRRRTKPISYTKEELSSESSPDTKTPNLIARLMGLDLLPDSFSTSPSSSSSSSIHTRESSRGKPNQHQLQGRSARARYELTGSRSLPETPRMSSARRSDVDPRLSLQINKENLIFPTEESNYSLPCSPYSSSSTTNSRKKEWRRHTDENRSPSHYARQMVKQVKERVGRKIGLDITNSGGNRVGEGDGLTKVEDESSPSKYSTPLCSPRLRFLEPKKKPVTVHGQSSHSPRPLTIPLPPSPPPPPPSPPPPPLQFNFIRKPKSKVLHPRAAKKFDKWSCERFTQRFTKPPHCSVAIRNMRQEQFLRPSSVTKANLSDKTFRKTPLSNDLVNIALPSLVPFQQGEASYTLYTPVSQASKRSSHLSSCSNRRYNNQGARHALPLPHQEDTKSNSTTTTGGAEFRYVSQILNLTGINNNALVSTSIWFSPYHPLDPSIFHNLQHFFLDATHNKEEEEETEDLHLGPLRHRCNRKLLFQLVDEILVDILNPYLETKPWLRSINHGCLPLSKQNRMTGLQLLQRLWSQIRGYPSAHCEILEDIDALIEKDLPNVPVMLPFLEEGESIVLEIEMDIIDSLVHETATEFRPPATVRDKLTSYPLRSVQILPAQTLTTGSDRSHMGFHMTKMHKLFDAHG